MSILLGAIFAFLAVACGAFGAHGLKESLDAYGLDLWHTAAQYQFFHAFALLFLGLFERQMGGEFPKIRWGFVVGIFLFSGSLYILALSGHKWLGMITPLGGLSFMFSWLALAYSAWRLRTKA